MNKNILWLSGVLVILILIAFFLMQQPGEQSRSESDGDLLLQFDSLAVDKIEIQSPTMAVTVSKRGAEWFVEQPLQYRADQNAVASLLHQAGTLEAKALVSDRDNKHGLFQVDSTGTLVTFYKSNEPYCAFVIGKSGPSYTDAYARRAESPEVFLVDGTIFYTVRRSVKEWRDRTIVNIPKDDIKEITYQYGDTTFSVTWQDSLWMIGGVPAKVEVVNPILSSLVSFQSDEFIDISPSPTPKLVATVLFAGIQLQFFQSKGSDKFYVRSSSSPQWFEVQDWRVNQVLKRRNEIVTMPS